MLGDGLGDAGLTATKGPWDGAGTTLHGGEEGVEDSLTSEEGDLTGELLGDRAGLSHGPEMTHVDLLVLAIVIEYNHGLAHGVHTCGHDLLDVASELGWDHDLVLLEQIVLEGVADNITAGHELAGSDLWVGSVLPVLVLVEAGHIDTTGHVDTS